MATSSTLQSLLRRYSSSSSLDTINFPSSLSHPKPNTPNSSLSYTHSNSLFITTALSASTSATTSAIAVTVPPAPDNTDLKLLEQHLISQNFRQADEETRRLLIALAGEAAQKRGYVFFSEAKFISETALISIDELWRKHSDNKFGYSIQKKIWEKSNKDFTRFFIKIGWMKLLDSEVVQYNYKAFPNEFMWELNDDTPVGHLPLTNALRGTQLFKSILTHTAFDHQGQDDDDVKDDNLFRDGSNVSSGNRVLKTDYSF